MSTETAQRPPLDPTRLRAVPGFTIEVVDRAASTNELVGERARAGAPEGLVVVAEHQTAGRGRLDRSWETPARAALTLSVLLRPAADPAQWPWLPLLAGVAVAEAVRGCGVPADLKWPNDVLVGGRKVAGVLVERVDTAQGAALVVGMGLNVTTTAEELPVDSATSLRIEGAEPDRTDLLVRVLAGLRSEYGTWLRPEGPAALRVRYEELCVTAHRQPVRVQLPAGEEITGDGCGIAATGALQVATTHGISTVTAGDVVHVHDAER